MSPHPEDTSIPIRVRVRVRVMAPHPEDTSIPEKVNGKSLSNRLESRSRSG